MKKIIYSMAALLAITFVNSCQTLEVAPPNNITDEQIQDMLKNGDESIQTLILNVVGSGLQSNFNVSGATWSGYSSYPLNSQVDQDFLMTCRGNDVVLGTAATAADHRSAYDMGKTF